MPRRHRAFLRFLLVSSLGLVACGGDDDDAGGGQVDAAGDDDADVDVDAAPHDAALAACEGFAATAAAATRLGDGVYASAATAAEPPADVLTVDHYFEFGAVDGPHTTVLGENYATCGDCILFMLGCTADGPCAHTLFAQSGSLEVTAIGAVDGSYSATLTDVQFAEVTIDEETFESTVIPGGEVRCIDSFTLEATVEGDGGGDTDPPL